MVEPALNGEEPSVSGEIAPPEPNGSEQSNPEEDQPEAIEPEAAAEPDSAPEPVVEAPATASPARAPEEPEAAAAVEPEPTPGAAAGREQPSEPEAAPEQPASEPALEPVPTPEVAAEEPSADGEEEPGEEPSSIADDISAAIAAAAATARASGEAAERAAAEVDTTIVLPEAEAVPVDGEAAEEGQEVAVPQLFQPGDWFVVHTYAGYENKVKANLQSRISSMNMEEKIFEVTIPMEDVMEIKSGKKQVVQRKVFPGYLLVRMDLDDDSWYVVRNTPGVTGFVGSGTRPIPLSVREVDRILRRKAVGERPKPKLEWSISDPVRVTTGPFANFQGVISEIDTDRSKLKVLVNIFGRETPVELGFDQVAKV